MLASFSALSKIIEFKDSQPLPQRCVPSDERIPISNSARNTTPLRKRLTIWFFFVGRCWCRRPCSGRPLIIHSTPWLRLRFVFLAGEHCDYETRNWAEEKIKVDLKYCFLNSILFNHHCLFVSRARCRCPFWTIGGRLKPGIRLRRLASDWDIL